MARTMQALMKTRSEPGLELCQVEVPTVKDDEVLVQVKAAAICGTDVHFYRWDAWAQTRIKPPLIVGHEFAGEVVEVGPKCTRLKVGDYVAADSHIACGKCPPCLAGDRHVCQFLKIMGNQAPGSMAEYVAMPESCGWVVDKSVPPEIAAVMEPLGGAVYCTLIEPVTGQSVAIFGDGPIALFAVGVAKAAGARTVYLVGKHEFRMNIARRMGADVVLNSQDPSLDVIAELKGASKGGAGFDIVLEMSGSEIAMKQGLKSLRNGGRYSSFGMFTTPPVVDLNYDVTLRGIRFLGVAGRLMWDTWIQMEGLLKSGALDPRPVITHCLPLKEADKGFQAILSAGREAAKVVLFPGR